MHAVKIIPQQLTSHLAGGGGGQNMDKFPREIKLNKTFMSEKELEVVSDR